MSIGEIELLGVPVLNISSAVLSGGTLTISGSGGSPGAGFSVVTNGSLSVPVGSWGVAATGNYDGSGNFSIGLPVSPSIPRLFYEIRTP